MCVFLFVWGFFKREDGENMNTGAISELTESQKKCHPKGRAYMKPSFVLLLAVVGP